MTGRSPSAGRVDIVIVNYETPNLLEQCLQAVERQSPTLLGDVVVVDNSPASDAAEHVVAAHPGVRLLVSPANDGYGAAANRGVRAGSGEYAVVLNADTQLHDGAVEALVAELDAHPEAAIVGPRLVDEEGRPQPSCARFPTPARVVLNETGLWKLGGPTRLGRAMQPFFDMDEPGAVPWVLGAALALRRTHFDAVDGFDPAYFMYYEEVDLCCRLAARGIATRFTPAAVVSHVGGASTSTNPVPMRRAMFRSLARFRRRYGHDPGQVRLRTAVIAIATARLARDLVVGPSAGRSRRRGALTAWRTLVGDAVRGWPE